MKKLLLSLITGLLPFCGSASVKMDFNGDGIADTFYQQNHTKEWVMGLQNGTEGIWYATVNDISHCCGWEFAGVGNFDNDDKSDILIRNISSGELYAYFMNEFQAKSSQYIQHNAAITEKLVAVADFNNDSFDDLLFRDTTSGAWRVFTTRNAQISTELSLDMAADESWQLVSVADFNNDQYPDVLLRNKSSGSWYMYQTNNLTITSKGYIDALPKELSTQFKSEADFNADGAMDLLVRSSETNNWHLYFLDGSKVIDDRTVFLNDDGQWKLDAADDFNGDGNADILLRNVNSFVQKIFIMDKNKVVTKGDSNWWLSSNVSVSSLQQTELPDVKSAAPYGLWLGSSVGLGNENILAMITPKSKLHLWEESNYTGSQHITMGLEFFLDNVNSTSVVKSGVQSSFTPEMTGTFTENEMEVSLLDSPILKQLRLNKQNLPKTDLYLLEGEYSSENYSLTIDDVGNFTITNDSDCTYSGTLRLFTWSSGLMEALLTTGERCSETNDSMQGAAIYSDFVATGSMQNSLWIQVSNESEVKSFIFEKK